MHSVSRRYTTHTIIYIYLSTTSSPLSLSSTGCPTDYARSLLHYCTGSTRKDSIVDNEIDGVNCLSRSERIRVNSLLHLLRYFQERTQK